MTHVADNRGLALAALAAALSLALLSAAPAESKKKKGGKSGGRVQITKTANQPIPDANPPFGDGALGRIDSTIVVGKEGAGRLIRDVNVTLQTQGTSNHTTPPAPSSLNGPTEAVDLIAILRAPNGAHLTLFSQLIPGLASPLAFAAFPSIGPLTVDDEARRTFGIFNPHDPFELYAPYAGAAKPQFGKPLALMDNGPVTGTWTLTVLDSLTSGRSNLVTWAIDVTAGKPFLTKGAGK